MMICLMSQMHHVLSSSFSNHFTCKIPGGLDHAKTVASDTGCELMYQVIPGGIFIKLNRVSDFVLMADEPF